MQENVGTTILYQQFNYRLFFKKRAQKNHDFDKYWCRRNQVNIKKSARTEIELNLIKNKKSNQLF